MLAALAEMGDIVTSHVNCQQKCSGGNACCCWAGMHVIHTCQFSDCPCHEQSQRPARSRRRRKLGGWDGNLFRLVWSVRKDALRAKRGPRGRRPYASAYAEAKLSR